MQEAGKLLSLLGATFLLLALVFNIMPRLPRLPGDLYIDKFGFKVYIPFASAIVASIILTLMFNFFKK